MSDLGIIITDATMLDEGPRGLIPRDYKSVGHGSLPYAGPMNMPVFTRKEIIERVRQREADGETLRQLCRDSGLTPKNQGQTNLCWSNSSVHPAEIWRLVQGQPIVRLSAASVAAPLTGYRNVGGWPTQSLQFLVDVGAAPESLWPNNEVTTKRYETAEVAAARPLYRIREWYDAVDGEQMDAEERFLRMATLLVLGYPCSAAYNWMRHAVTPVDMILLPNTADQLGVFCHNSGYGRDANGFTTLTGTRAIPDECLAPRSVTASLSA